MTKPAKNVLDLDAKRKARGVGAKVVRVNGKSFELPGVLPLGALPALSELSGLSGNPDGIKLDAIMGPLEEAFGPVVRELAAGGDLAEELGGVLALYGMTLGE